MTGGGDNGARGEARAQQVALETEDADTARLVMRIQAGDGDLFAVLYLRYFDRVYSYFRIVLESPEEAEAAAQDVFLKVLDALPSYERRRAPFRAWMFTIVRNHALRQLELRRRVEPMPPESISELRERSGPGEDDLDALDWITDRELVLFIERLPLAQRQVLFLRYVAGLSTNETAAIMERSATDVRTLHHRALRFLEDRLTALGRTPASRERTRMRTCKQFAPVLRSRRFSL
jgi:RNA polymerase sigma-70 factor (ECF subfamily)